MTLLAGFPLASAALNVAVLLLVARLLRARTMTLARAVLVFLVGVAFGAPC